MSFERRKIRTGRVISDKMEKTLVVDVEWRSSHRLYKKAVRRRTRIYVHDPENQGKLGDVVQVIENRPTSKTKRWRLTNVLEKADLAELQPDEINLEDTSVLVYTPDAPVEALIAVDDSADPVDEEMAGEVNEEPSDTSDEVTEQTVDEVEAAPEVADDLPETSDEVVEQPANVIDPVDDAAKEEPVAEVAGSDEDAADESDTEASTEDETERSE